MAMNERTVASVDPDVALAYKFPEVSFAYDERDVALYALGVGACGADAVDDKELHLVHHRDGQRHIKALPTFVSLFPNKNSNGRGIVNVPGIHFDESLLLHGQQYIEIYKPIPSCASVVNKVKVAGLHDKGKATILEIETMTSLKDSGEVLCMNRSTIFLRGAGGFSDSSRPYSYTTYPANQISRISIPNSAPSAVHEDQTQQSQALLYRLSGDYNPLHSDPMVAQIAGFTRPILHGLCTLGFAARAVIKSFCNGDPAAVQNIFGRFLLHVYPGETLVTEMWVDGQRVQYQTKAKERDRAVLSGYVLLKHIPSSLAMTPPPPLDEDDEDPLEEAICAQRIWLSEEEVCNLWDIILPRADIVGVPFVTRLTSTMVDRHVMKLPKSLSVSCGIEPDEEGSAGIRLTARGSVTTCAYGVDEDGRTHLSSVGWKSFLDDNNLHIGQAILITIRNTHRQGLRMMIVIDII